MTITNIQHHNNKTTVNNKNRSDSSICNQQKIMKSLYMDLNDTRMYDEGTFKSIGEKVRLFCK